MGIIKRKNEMITDYYRIFVPNKRKEEYHSFVEICIFRGGKFRM